MAPEKQFRGFFAAFSVLSVPVFPVFILKASFPSCFPFPESLDAHNDF
jgi:hypothetical protein